MPGPIAIEDDLTVRCADHGVIEQSASPEDADIAVVEHLDAAHPEISDE